MISTHARIWVWMQDNEMFKAVYIPESRVLTISNERDDLILQYKGINSEQLARVEYLFMTLGAKKINGRSKPFTYL